MRTTNYTVTIDKNGHDFDQSQDFAPHARTRY